MSPIGSIHQQPIAERINWVFELAQRYSAEDARRAGFSVLVIEDACRGIDVEGSVLATRQEFDGIGVDCVFADAIG